MTDCTQTPSIPQEYSSPSSEVLGFELLITMSDADLQALKTFDKPCSDFSISLSDSDSRSKGLDSLEPRMTDLPDNDAPIGLGYCGELFEAVESLTLESF